MSLHLASHLRQAVLALGVAAVFGASAATTDAQFVPAFQQFQAAQTGDADALGGAAEQFNTLLKADPANPTLLAYAGAATALKSKTTVMPWKKMSYAEDGLAQIDKALALLQPVHDAELLNHVPLSLQTRFVAASTFLGLPPFFNRGPRGAKLLGDVQASPLFAQSPLGFQGAVLMRAAQLAAAEHRVDDARRNYTQVIDRAMPQADAAKAQREGLPQ